MPLFAKVIKGVTLSKINVNKLIFTVYKKYAILQNPGFCESVNMLHSYCRSYDYVKFIISNYIIKNFSRRNIKDFSN